MSLPQIIYHHHEGHRPHHFIFPVPYRLDPGDWPLESNRRAEIKIWCEETLRKAWSGKRNWRWCSKYNRIEIRSDNDALMFRMRWC